MKLESITITSTKLFLTFRNYIDDIAVGDIITVNKEVIPDYYIENIRYDDGAIVLSVKPIATFWYDIRISELAIGQEWQVIRL